jgi:hypothetical protein
MQVDRLIAVTSCPTFSVHVSHLRCHAFGSSYRWSHCICHGNAARDNQQTAAASTKRHRYSSTTWTAFPRRFTGRDRSRDCGVPTNYAAQALQRRLFVRRTNAADCSRSGIDRPLDGTIRDVDRFQLGTVVCFKEVPRDRIPWK